MAAGAEAAGAWSGFLPRVSVSEFFLRSDDALMAFGYKLQNRGVAAADFDRDGHADRSDGDADGDAHGESDVVCRGADIRRRS